VFSAKIAASAIEYGHPGVADMMGRVASAARCTW
jgi:hypothetical protein